MTDRPEETVLSDGDREASPPSTFLDQLRRRHGEGRDPQLTLAEPEGSDEGAPVPARREGAGADRSRRPRYRTQAEIARGGMGAILRVWDADLRRKLAMKLALTEPGPDGTPSYPRLRLERFLEEAQITAQLDHPGVVPVHELGFDALGRVYFTMKMVKGRDLREVFARHRAGDPEWTQARCLGLLLKACEALSYAHDKGVVHRDLKPANIMVGRYGEVYVMDWGLAKVLGRSRPEPAPADDAATFSQVRTDRDEESGSGSDSASYTLDGAAVGTPYYMPPEQAAGRHAAIGAHSDVYAVGAILYQLLAGRAPYQIPDGRLEASTVLALVIQGPPTPLAELARRAPPELIAICDKAMQREPGDRYASTGELAADLRGFLEGRVVRAYAHGAVAEFKKWVRRNRRFALMLSLLLGLALGGASWIAIAEAERARVAAAAERIERDKNQLLDEANASLHSTNQQLAEANTELEAARAEAERAALQARAERDTADQVIDAVVELFQDIDPDATGEHELTARQLLERGTQDMLAGEDADPAVRARLLCTLGKALFNLREYDRAVPILEAADAALRETAGEADPERLELALDKAAALEKVERLVDSERCFREVLELRQRELGPDHADALAAEQRLAQHLLQKGRLRESGPMLAESLERHRRALGEDHPATLTSKQEHAMFLWKVGRAETARAALEDVVARSRRVHGVDHPRTLDAQKEFGYVLSSSGELERAHALQVETLRRLRESVGREHPETFQVLFDLASTLDRMGQPEQRDRLLEEDAEERARRLPADDPRLLNAIKRHAVNRYEEELLLEALETHRRALGPDHPRSLDVQNLVAVYYMDGDGDRERALPYLEDCLERRRRLLGEDDPETLRSRRNLAAHLFDTRQDERALELLEEMSEREVRVLGEQHPLRLRSREWLADLHRDQGRIDLAVEIFADTLEHWRQTVGPHDRRVLDLMGDVAFCHVLEERWDLALPLLETRLEGMRDLVGDEHPDTLLQIESLGVRYQAAGRPEAAIPLVEEVLQAVDEEDDIEALLDFLEELRDQVDGGR